MATSEAPRGSWLYIVMHNMFTRKPPPSKRIRRLSKAYEYPSAASEAGTSEIATSLGLEESELFALRDAFKKLDKNGDARLSMNELLMRLDISDDQVPLARRVFEATLRRPDRGRSAPWGFTGT